MTTIRDRINLFNLDGTERKSLKKQHALSALKLRLERLATRARDQRGHDVQYEDGYIVFNATELGRLEHFSGLDAQQIVSLGNSALFEQHQPFALALKLPLTEKGDKRPFMTVHLRTELYTKNNEESA